MFEEAVSEPELCAFYYLKELSVDHRFHAASPRWRLQCGGGSGRVSWRFSRSRQL